MLLPLILTGWFWGVGIAALPETAATDEPPFVFGTFEPATKSLEIYTPDDAPALLSLRVCGEPIVEVANKAIDSDRPSNGSAWLDPTPTNLVLRLYVRPIIVEENGVWVITFK